MVQPTSVVMRTFLPAKNLATSRSFYEALGFKKLLDSEVSIFSCGSSGGFILQDRWVKEWAENCMMQLMVPDLDVWWTHIQNLDLPSRFAVTPPTPPQMQPWGLRVSYVYDPSGVLWHVAEVRPGVSHDQT